MVDTVSSAAAQDVAEPGTGHVRVVARPRRATARVGVPAPRATPAPARPAAGTPSRTRGRRVVVTSAAVAAQPAVAPPLVVADVEAQPEPAVRRVGAWRVLGVLVVAVVTATLLNSRSLLRSAENMPDGVLRSALLSVAHPVDQVATDLHLTAPRQALDRALGRAGSDGQGVGPGLSSVTVPPQSAGALAPAAPATAPPGGAGPGAAAPPPPVARPVSLRPVDQAHPLRLWVTGDSQISYLGDDLAALVAGPGTVASFKPAAQDSTGLVRPDTFDWLQEARAGTARHHPDAVVITLGSNDFEQGIPAGKYRAYHAGSADWARTYQARAEAVMRALTGDGQRPVYWVTVPTVRDAGFNRAVQALDDAVLRAAAAVPGVVVVDARPLLADHGHYTAYRGTTLIRQSDGVHMTLDGARIVARALLQAIDADWHLGA